MMSDLRSLLDDINKDIHNKIVFGVVAQDGSAHFVEQITFAVVEERFTILFSVPTVIGIQELEIVD